MTERLTPMEAIKKKCKDDCCAGQENEWKNCPITTCALFPYRFGHNPARAGVGRSGGNPNIGKIASDRKKQT
jgi:hypothetical protein